MPLQSIQSLQKIWTGFCCKCDSLPAQVWLKASVCQYKIQVIKDFKYSIQTCWKCLGVTLEALLGLNIYTTK